MGKAFRASALLLLLACSAHAGIMQNDVTGTPPPNAAQAEQTADGDIQNGAADSLTETVLGLLGSVLALL